MNIDNKDPDIESKELDNEQIVIKRRKSMIDSKKFLLLDLNSYDESSNSNGLQDDDLKSYSNKIKSSKKNLDDSSTIKSDINRNEISLISNEKLNEMPFLIYLQNS